MPSISYWLIIAPSRPRRLLFIMPSFYYYYIISSPSMLFPSMLPPLRPRRLVSITFSPLFLATLEAAYVSAKEALPLSSGKKLKPGPPPPKAGVCGMFVLPFRVGDDDGLALIPAPKMFSYYAFGCGCYSLLWKLSIMYDPLLLTSSSWLVS